MPSPAGARLAVFRGVAPLLSVRLLPTSLFEVVARDFAAAAAAVGLPPMAGRAAAVAAAAAPLKSL